MDAEGRFTFAELPSGTYQMVATKPGYLDMMYGARQPGAASPGVAIGHNDRIAFGLTVVPATMLLLAYEARLAIRGLGGSLQIPADPSAARAGAALAARGAAGGCPRQRDLVVADQNLKSPNRTFAADTPVSVIASASITNPGLTPVPSTATRALRPLIGLRRSSQSRSS